MDLQQLLQTIGVAGLSAWVLWWVLTRQIPAMQAEHRQALERQQADHNRDVGEVLARVVTACDRMTETMQRHDALVASRCGGKGQDV